MPALTRIRIPALLDLAEQQRYTPRKAVLRQIGRAEALAVEIDPKLTYPEDWVIFRITGFRPSLDDPRILPGEALRGDLSALVERLSDRAGLTIDGLEGPVVSVDALSERWSVSRKTIERYRRRGLVGRRVVDRASSASGAAATRLVFMVRGVEAFERANPGLLGEAAGFGRLDEAERRRVVAWAERYHRRLGWTRNQIVGRLASRLGRGRETVRRALEDVESVPAGERLAPDATREIFEGARRGVEPRELGARFGRSRATIHRVVNARRAEMLRRLDLSVPIEPRPSIDDRLLGVLSDTSVREGLAVRVVLDPSAWIEEARGAAAEGAGEEQARSIAHHVLRDRARRIVEGLDRHNPSGVDLDRAETDLRWATLLKRALVHAQRGLIVRSIEERAGGSLEELSRERLRELHRVSHAAVAYAVDRHWRGRLAAPASLALGRVLGQEPEVGAPSGRASRRGAGEGVPLSDWTAALSPWQAWLDPPAGVLAAGESLGARATALVTARFGLDGRAPMTLDEIESAIGIGRGAASALLRAAIRASVASALDAPFRVP